MAQVCAPYGAVGTNAIQPHLQTLLDGATNSDTGLHAAELRPVAGVYATAACVVPSPGM